MNPSGKAPGSGDDLPLGREVGYSDAYDASLLRPVPRAKGRSAWIGAGASPPFQGEDVWHCHELSWLGVEGVPRIAIARLRVPCDSPNLVESKSLKLYLGSLAQTEIQTRAAVCSLLSSDIGGVVGCPVGVELLGVGQLPNAGTLAGQSLDELAPTLSVYRRDPRLLTTTGALGSDCIHTNLFRSVCPITGQPDWGSILIAYEGRLLKRESVLAYLVSHRLSPGFHEDAVERIFVDMQQAAEPTRLSVHGRFLRRGGIDINPFRSLQQQTAPLDRAPRQ